MNPRRLFSGLLLIVALALVGLALAAVPPWLIAQYRVAAELSPFWGGIYLAAVGTGLLLLVGCGIWIAARLWWATWKKRYERRRREAAPRSLSAAEKQRQIGENLDEMKTIAAGLDGDDLACAAMEKQADDLLERLESQRLEIVAFGAISSGKSSLLNALAGRDVFATDVRGGTTQSRNETPWPGDERVRLVDAPGLAEVGGALRQQIARDAARSADLVLLVVDGPLRDFEFELLRILGDMEKPILVCLTKEDWYAEEDRRKLFGQIAEQLRGVVEPKNVLAVRPRPVCRTRVTLLADGTQQEEAVEVPADIEPLARRMLEVVRHDGQDMLLSNLLLQSRGLLEETRQAVRESLDRAAWRIVNRYMWLSGGATAVVPWPVVDVIAGCAVSTKMVAELAAVYRQQIDLRAAETLLAELAKVAVGVLGAGLAVPGIAAIIASALKTVPGVGTVAGGVLQGLVTAVVVRWVGGVFIEYFRNEMQTPARDLPAIARRQWEQVTEPAVIRQLWGAARTRMPGEVQGEGKGMVAGK